jgi:hypothetical protein
MHALIIYLSKDLERGRILIEKLKALNFEVILIEGLDGSTVDPQDDQWLGFKERAEKRYKRVISINEYACLSSHIKAMNFVLTNAINDYIIFEDDALIKSETVIPTNNLKHNDMFFYGGLEGLEIQHLKIWKNHHKSVFTCCDFRFIQRACAYQMGHDVLTWYVKNMLKLGIINDDWNSLSNKGVIKNIYLKKVCGHPEINTSYIADRGLDNLGWIFRVKMFIYNYLHFYRFSYMQLEYEK